MPELFAPTLTDQIAEVKREITLRQNVYPRWVEAARLTQKRADRQIENMKAVLETLEGLQGA